MLSLLRSYEIPRTASNVSACDGAIAFCHPPFGVGPVTRDTSASPVLRRESFRVAVDISKSSTRMSTVVSAGVGRAVGATRFIIVTQQFAS